MRWGTRRRFLESPPIEQRLVELTPRVVVHLRKGLMADDLLDAA